MKRLVMKSQKRPATPVSPPDDPVKRRLLKKTDLKSDDVLMPVEIRDTDLLYTVNTLLDDETDEEQKQWNEEKQWTKNLVSTGRSRRNDEGKAERAELTERNGCNDNCETIRGSRQTSDSNTRG